MSSQPNKAAKPRKSSLKDTRPIWELIKEIGESVPEEEWAKLPNDLSINYRHYLYGTPKVELPKAE